MYPITETVRALFEAENAKVLRITGSTVKKLPSEISVYNGDELIYQSGDGKHLKLYSGSTEIYDSQDAHVVILYSGTEPIFINDEAGMPIQIEITSDNVRESSFFIDRYSCNGEKLEVGTAIAAEMKLTLDNADGQFDGVVFEGTELFVEVGVADWTQENPAVNWVPCGYFTPDEQPRRLTTITIEALDRMTRFDVAVDATALTFPTTIAGLVGQVCTACGVTLAQSISVLINADVTVAELPSNYGQITYRNIIQWCAGIMGTNAWFDWNGQLRFSWYDNTTGYVSTMDNRYSSDLYEDDLTITGVEYTNDSGIAIVEGTDDYAIDLTGNTIAGPLIATVLPPLNTMLNGFTYRPFTAAVVNAPYLWPMDIVTFTDKGGNNHTGALTNVAFGLNGTTALESKGMTYAINKAAQPKGFTREQAQLISQVAQNIETNIDESLTQQEIFNRLTDNGAAQGLVLYNGQLYINASYINAGFLNVGRINFNEPDRYYDVPDENDPDSLLSGQTVADGWIVNTSGSGNITVFSCGFAIPLRGKTITVTFAFNGNLNGGENTWTSISDNALEMLDIQDWLVPSSGTPSNPYTYSVTVPSDAMSFHIAMECAGVKQIAVSLSSPVTPSESIVYNYEGQKIGEANKFLVYRDGTLITSAKSIFNGTTRISRLYLNIPLDVASGGTGATNAAGARANLEITPANIGAKPTQTAVADPTASGTAVAFIDSITQDANGVITPTKKTVRSASQSEIGLMSATDKAKLDGIAAGAQVNSLTGVKGNAETDYRTGNVNLTSANVGASISLTSTDTTAALLYNKLKDLELNYPASIRVVNEPMQSLTGKSISGGYGTVVKTGVESGTLVLSFDICYVAGNYRHAFTTRVSQNTITPGAVYRYTGTAVS